MTDIAFVCYLGSAHSPTGEGNFKLFMEENGISGVETAHVGMHLAMLGQLPRKGYYNSLREARIVVNCFDLEKEGLDDAIRQINPTSPIFHYYPYSCPLDEEKELFNNLVTQLREKREPQ